MSDIFISYSSKDREKADELAKLLASAGRSVWIDRQGIEAATSWSKEIAEALESCSTFIVLLSQRSVGSENVAKELAIAAKLRKKIIPVRLERVELKGEFLYHLTSLQHVEHTNIDGILRGIDGRRSTEPSESTEVPEFDAAPSRVRIAVLPFEDQSPSRDHEWFSDGLTDELISTLNKLDALFVLDRRSSQVYKGVKLSVKQIAQELAVAYVVTGAVRKAAEKIRIQASLVDASTGATIWDEKFTGTMDDIFEIQERTALDICKGLKLRLTKEEVAEIEERGTDNTEAYELYLRTTHVGFAGKAEMLGRIELLKRVVALDPNFARAHAAIAVTCANYQRNVEPDPAILELQELATQKAIELAPGTRTEYYVLSNLYSVRGETEKAIETAKKMIAASPKHSLGYGVVGFMYLASGQFAEAIPWISKALEIDQSLLNDYANLYSCYRYLGDMQGMTNVLNRAAPKFEQYLAHHPDDQPVRIILMFMLELANRHAESVREAERLLLLPEAFGAAYYNAAGIFTRAGNIERAIELLRIAAQKGEFNQNDLRGNADIWSNIHALPNYDALMAELDSISAGHHG